MQHKSYVAQILENNEIEGESTIYIVTPVEKGHSERILVGTLYNIHIFKFKAFSFHKGYKQSYKIRYDQIITIKSDNRTSFELHTKNKILTFTSKNAEKILTKIVSHLMTIIPKTELPYFSFPSTLLSSMIRKEAMSNRILFVSYLTSREPPEDILKIITKIAMGCLKGKSVKQKIFKLDAFKNYYSFMDLILDSLNVFPIINRIIVPKPVSLVHPYWGILADFFAKNQTIQTIETFEPISHDFNRFVDVISSSPQSKIQSLGFYNAGFGPNFVLAIGNILSHRQMKSIYISNGLNLKGYQTLVPLLRNNSGFQSLTTLSLSESNYISFSDIISALPKLQELHLIKCSIDLSKVFQILSIYQNIELKELRLSGNRFLSPIIQDIILPEKLQSLYLDKVEWTSNSLQKLFLAISNLKKKNSQKSIYFFTLSIRNAMQAPSQWETFETFLSTFVCDCINKLSYDWNPIRKGFIEFLRNAKTLSILSLHACLFNDAPYLKEIAQAIGDNKSIENICLSGDKNHVLSKSFSIILEGLIANNTIKLIDISHNNIGNVISKYILRCLTENCMIYEIYFDDNYFLDPKEIKSFFQEIKKLGQRVKLSLPRTDLTKLKQANKITDEEIMEIYKIIKECQSIKPYNSLSNPSVAFAPTTVVQKFNSNELQLNSFESFNNDYMPYLSGSSHFISYVSGVPSQIQSNTEFTTLPFPYDDQCIDSELKRNVEDILFYYLKDSEWESKYGVVEKIDFSIIYNELSNEYSLENLLESCNQ